MHYNQVAVWRGRYGESVWSGLADEERPGRPPVYGHDDVMLLVKTATEPPPEAATRWTMEALARGMNEHGVAISASQVWRICRSLDLKPWQYRVVDDQPRPRFLGQGRPTCVGCMSNPPVNAVVWSVDEKTGMQATSRGSTRPARRPPGSGAARVRVPPARHAVLYAGLNVHDGEVTGWVTDSTRADNFIAFLTDLVAEHPAGLQLHCIVDNLRRTPEASTTFLGQRRTCFAPHADPRFVVEPGRAVLLDPATPSDALRRVRLRRRPRRQSSRSSTTTTSGPSRSAGPTTAGHSKPA